MFLIEVDVIKSRKWKEKRRKVVYSSTLPPRSYFRRNKNEGEQQQKAGATPCSRERDLKATRLDGKCDCVKGDHSPES